MNRRDFFKALVAVGASTALAESLVTQAFSPLPVSGPANLLGPEAGIDFERLMVFSLEGAEDAPRAGCFALRRTNSTSELMRFTVNAYGGPLSWLAPIGGEIIIPRGQSIELLADFDGAVSLVTETNTDEVRIYYFSLSREHPPRLLQRVSFPKVMFESPPIDEAALDAGESE